jgi:S-adenosylmethionine:tRNA ribosyltransferase-isomerase
MASAESQPSRAVREAGAAEDPAIGFDYELPPERIAQEPAAERDAARLLVVRRGAADAPVDAGIRDLPRLLRAGDLLVVNRSRVFPARLRGRRLPGGGAVEILLVARLDAGSAGERWRTMGKPARRLAVGQRIVLERGPSAGAEVEARPGAGGEVEARIESIGDGWIDLAFPPGVDAIAAAERIGETPLPPYIRRPAGPTTADAERYQTVFAREPGSIAAPTAGLHLTDRVLGELRAAGIALAEVVLHVGPATFLAGQPGRAALAVEPERYEVPAATRDAIAATRAAGGRVVAVGTTTTRALESAARAGWPAGPTQTELVLRPGDRFVAIDALMTNFHLPGSSLLALVSAFAGVETARAAYTAALARGYRFYSYGDAMLAL